MQFLATFRKGEGNYELNLMSQYQLFIPDKCHVAIKLFCNFEARFWKSDHMTMNSPRFTFFPKLMQC